MRGRSFASGPGGPRFRPKPGAMDALRLLARHRAVLVYTARPMSWLPEVADWVLVQRPVGIRRSQPRAGVVVPA